MNRLFIIAVFAAVLFGCSSTEDESFLMHDPFDAPAAIQTLEDVETYQCYADKSEWRQLNTSGKRRLAMAGEYLRASAIRVDKCLEKIRMRTLPHPDRCYSDSSEYRQLGSSASRRLAMVGRYMRYSAERIERCLWEY